MVSIPCKRISINEKPFMEYKTRDETRDIDLGSIDPRASNSPRVCFLLSIIPRDRLISSKNISRGHFSSIIPQGIKRASVIFFFLVGGSHAWEQLWRKTVAGISVLPLRFQCFQRYLVDGARDRKRGREMNCYYQHRLRLIVSYNVCILLVAAKGR